MPTCNDSDTTQQCEMVGGPVACRFARQQIAPIWPHTQAAPAAPHCAADDGAPVYPVPVLALPACLCLPLSASLLLHLLDYSSPWWQSLVPPQEVP